MNVLQALKRFGRFVDSLPVERRDRFIDRMQDMADAGKFKESEHPRGKGEKGGQFVKKGEGGSGTGKATAAKAAHATSPKNFKPAPQAQIKPYSVEKFRAPKKGDKIVGIDPDTLKPKLDKDGKPSKFAWTNVKVNPDPKGDVAYVGINGYGKPSVAYTPAFFEKQKAIREKEWPKWAIAAKVPPVWTDIKLAPGPDSDVLATGVDATGKRTALYSPQFKESNNKQKHARVKELDAKIDKIYARLDKDRQSKQVNSYGNHELRQVAQVASLIAQMGLRPGGDASSGAAKKGKIQSYGALDLESKHVVKDGRNEKVYLRFIGKKGQPNEFLVSDPNTVKWLLEAKRVADLPDSEDHQSHEGYLFPWATKSSLSKYTKSIGAAKTKDFRTRIGTTAANDIISEMAAPKTAKEFKKMRESVGELVSNRLNNTKAVALSAYIDREVFKNWAAGLSKADQGIIKW